MSSVQYLIGKTLDKYEILDHIGHGGMSEVYKGQQAQLNRLVAIKVLHPFLADEEGFVVRFQREARIVATLRHPHIVQVFDFDYNEELAIYYMVMEYIDGPTLKDLLGKDPISPEETARIGAAIADALDYAHQHSMVHRDIKPANIMFLEGHEPVLTDFGIAKMLTLSGLTASGAMVGTPAYMAPEIGIGKAGTALSDLYSLGVVLYQAVSGSLPFNADTPMGMVMQHINNTPPPPSRYRPGIPEPLEKVILKALEKQPGDRYARAKDMAIALQQAVGLLNGAAVIGMPTTPLPGDPVATPADRPFTATRESTPAPNGGPAAENAAAGELTDDPLADERLVRSWTPLSHRAAEPSTAEDGATQPEKAHKRPARQPVWLRSGLIVLIALLSAAAVWLRTGDVPALLSNLLATESPPTASPATPQPPALTPTPSEDGAVAAAMTTPTALPTPTTVASPTPAVPCALRVKLDGTRVEPHSVVAPGTPLVAYITMHNSGTCSWPAEAALAYDSDAALGAPALFPIGAVAPAGTIQALLPLRAPETAGTYQGVWHMQDADGHSFGSRIVIEIEVDESLPLETATAIAAPSIETPVPEPLTLADPILVSWQDDPAAGRWAGIVEFQPSGGSGTYQLYRGEIGPSTALAGNTLAFTWRRCESLPVDLTILSGAEVLQWHGEIPYPAPERCQ